MPYHNASVSSTIPAKYMSDNMQDEATFCPPTDLVYATLESNSMPRHRPATSGYARIAQVDEENGYIDDSDEEEALYTPRTISASAPRYAPIQPQSHAPMFAALSDSSLGHHRRPSAGRRRMRRNSSGVDIKAINARLERWAEEIASKFKINRVRGKTNEEEQLEIQHSVFQPPEGIRPASAETLAPDGPDGHGDCITKMEFDDIVESVKVAIELGVHPKMISQGSSGSYFARNSDGKVVGVFKPKDEEPYASRNPKWTKWIHRNLFPCFFGRACLIPNLSYVSEAAAYVLDTRLQTHLVPYTDIVYLSSRSFFYDFWDRSNYYRKRKPLPVKVGSFQVFLKGFTDANIFLRDHPWPDQVNSGFRPQDAQRKKRRNWADTCRPSSAVSDDEEEAAGGLRTAHIEEDPPGSRFVWTDTLQQSFREELEKLVILDYIMRNTDRGLDNWMIKVDPQSHEVSIVSEPLRNGNGSKPTAVPISKNREGLSITDPSPYKRQESMVAMNGSSTPSNVSDTGGGPTISIGAIDNSLSWPWKHPDAVNYTQLCSLRLPMLIFLQWRSFPFGWLFLPVSLIGRPFSSKTRDHFLPLLTSKQWWSETQMALRRVFSQDSDFQEKMFAKQIAVMKGQAWNVVETLKTPDHGPLELTRRTRVCVWDDLVDIPVAIPMRVPSAEMRRQRNAQSRNSIEEEEMDISAANTSQSAQQYDLLGLSSPPTELPNPNRFDLSRHGSSDSVRPAEGHGTPATVNDVTFDHNSDIRASRIRNVKPLIRPGTKTRLSFEEPRKSPGLNSHRRRYSYSTRNGSTLFLYDGDDLEGDLGYAAAEGMEGSQRRVIVERLETVKSKNPVFSWC